MASRPADAAAWRRCLSRRRAWAGLCEISHSIFSLCPFRPHRSLAQSASHDTTNTASDPANKRLFSHPRVAADLIRLLGDDWVGNLDLDRLEQLRTEYVSGDLRTRRANLPSWAPFKPGTGQPDRAGDVPHRVPIESGPAHDGSAARIRCVAA